MRVHRRLTCSHRVSRSQLELLPSLDDLCERVTLHLNADCPGDVLPLMRIPLMVVCALSFVQAYGQFV